MCGSNKYELEFIFFFLAHKKNALKLFNHANIIVYLF